MNRITDLQPLKSIVLTATAFLLLAAQSCSLDRDIAGKPETQIAFSTNLGNMTKASEMTAAGIDSIEVWGFLQDVSPQPVYLHDIFRRDGDRFVSKQSYYWPGERQLYFIAYLPEQLKHFGASVNTGNRWLTNVTVKTDISQQVDLISA